MSNELHWYSGTPVCIATREYQHRKHHKKRINKKWRKRYGVEEINLMPHGQVVFNEVDRVFYMTKKTWRELKSRCLEVKQLEGDKAK